MAEKRPQFRSARRIPAGLLLNWQIRSFSNPADASTTPHPAKPTGTRIPKPVTLGARPFLFLSTFLVVHQALATTSLVPTYYWFSSVAPGSSTALLAGPTAAWALKQPLPWNSSRTVEDLVEGGIRASLGGGWSVLAKWRSRRAQKAADNEDADAGQAEAEGRRGFGVLDKLGEVREKAKARIARRDEDEVAHEAVEELEGKRPTAGSAWRDRVVQGASGLKARQVIDFAAAYLTVKALFPVRLGLSLYITPRVARRVVSLFR